LVLRNGTLQEAGCMIWGDGSAMNVGRGEDPERPEYNFVRDVDYCSGAGIILRADLYRQLGGFDLYYAPGYYEDGDLAFKVRALGQRVVYQPLARVNHYEGGTAGTDISKGVKRYQVINQEKFIKRWRDVIAGNGLRPVDERPAYDRRPGERVLIVDHTTPRRDQDSGSVRMHGLIRLLAGRGLKVTFAADNLERVSPYTEDLQRLGVEVLYQPFVPSLEDHLARVGGRYQMVILSKRDPAWKHLDAVRRYAPSAFLAFDTVDLHFVREAREAELKRDRALAHAARQAKARELELVRRADCTLVVSEAERELLQRELGPVPVEVPVEVIGNLHEIREKTPPFAERRDLLFVGYFTHTPNADAMLFFLREVFPSLRRRIPGVTIRVIGRDPPVELATLASEDVQVYGQVPDLEPHLLSARVMVAPLRFGAGVKGKVTQSLSYGLPVVATPVAAEGMGLTDGENVLIGERAADLVEQIARLYNDEKLWRKLSANGLQHARAHFSVEAMRARVERLVELSHAERPPRDAAPAAESALGGGE
jgi:glycosyltransferase involved in cell wall biosynthesis